MKKSFVILLFVLLNLSVLSASPLWVDNLNSITTFFGPHEEILKLVSQKSGFKIKYCGLSFFTDELNFSVLDTGLNYLAKENQAEEAYIYSVPYIYDECVMVSRVDENVEVLLDYENKKFLTFKTDPLGKKWTTGFGIENYDDSYSSAAEVFFSIARGCGNYTFISSRLAYLLRDELGLSDVLTISHPIFGINYRFVMEKKDYREMEKLNTILIEFLDSEEIKDIYLKYGIRPKIEPYIKANTALIVSISLLVVMLFIAVFIMLKIIGGSQGEEL